MTPDFDELWGATIRGLHFDVAARRLLIDIELDAPVDTLPTPGHPDRRLIFEQVSELHWETEASGDWDYVELTEVHVSQTSDSRSAVELVLWAEPNGVRVICDHADVVEIG